VYFKIVDVSQYNNINSYKNSTIKYTKPAI